MGQFREVQARAPSFPLPIDVVIPALDEADAIGIVVAGVPRPPVRSVVVIDNGSTDATAAMAAASGASVVVERQRGYGSACLAGLAALPKDGGIVVFMDGDGSDDPASIPALVAPIVTGIADFVVGTRTLGVGSLRTMTAAQRAGNVIAAAWLRRRFDLPATDLGPFRAIRACCLERLRMTDRGYGWTVEMQIKAARAGLRYREVAVSSRRRLGGRSKISGTITGTMGAAAKIIGLLARHDLASR